MQEGIKEMVAILAAYPDDPVTDLGDDLTPGPLPEHSLNGPVRFP
jgi:hypothetical protein